MIDENTHLRAKIDDLIAFYKGMIEIMEKKEKRQEDTITELIEVCKAQNNTLDKFYKENQQLKRWKSPIESLISKLKGKPK